MSFDFSLLRYPERCACSKGASLSQKYFFEKMRPLSEVRSPHYVLNLGGSGKGLLEARTFVIQDALIDRVRLDQDFPLGHLFFFGHVANIGARRGSDGGAISHTVHTQFRSGLRRQVGGILISNRVGGSLGSSCSDRFSSCRHVCLLFVPL